jgi:hypothetical protein
MKLKRVGLSFACLLFTAASMLGAGHASGSQIEQVYGRLPLYFVENRGQVGKEVFYYLPGRDSVYFTSRGMTLALTSEEEKRWAVAVDLVGARRGVKPEPRSRTEAVVSYFKGPRPNWKTGISTYGSVVYRDAWPGIDVSWSGTAGRLEDTFVVRPGADPGRIRLRYRGATSVKLDETNGLEVKTRAGGFRVGRPRAYQELNGKQKEVPVTFALARKGANPVYGFQVGQYDRTRPLVIDPVVLLYCGYIGGGKDDYGHGIAVDGAGNAYVVGSTLSADASFPVVVGPDLTPKGLWDVFVAKVKADGTGLVYAGYIGGDDWDEGHDIAVDAAGNAYVTGTTLSDESSFPLAVGPQLAWYGGGTAFVAKIRADGSGLQYAGYIGGNGVDGVGIAVDGAGNAYVTGRVGGSQSRFPAAVGPDLSFNGNEDAFVAKVRAEGTGFVYAGYIGGAGDDVGRGIAVDSGGSAYVAGYTRSDEMTFPVTVGPDLSFNGGDMDAFVAKVKADGTGLVYAGYIGGGDGEDGFDIAVDSAGCAYVTGSTASDEATFPVVVGPDLTYNLGVDAYAVKVKADGTGFVYAGYIGGSLLDHGYAIAVDGEGSAYVTGRTYSDETSFPVTGGPDLTYNGNRDAYVAKVKADGTGLVYAGYVEGDDWEDGWGIAVDNAENAYITAYTRSTEATFPVAVGPDLTYNGFSSLYGDAFVAKVGLPCVEAAAAIRQVRAVKERANPDDIDFTWFPDGAGTGYNIWYVTSKEEIPQARQSSSPPAIPVTGCAVPSPATATACTDQGAVSRDAPTAFFYQIRTYCDALNEGP